MSHYIFALLKLIISLYGNDLYNTDLHNITLSIVSMLSIYIYIFANACFQDNSRILRRSVEVSVLGPISRIPSKADFGSHVYEKLEGVTL